LLSVELGKARKTLSTADVNDFVYELKQMSGNIQRVLNSASDIRECAKIFADADQFLFMGRGANYPAALEGALKLKEISYIPAEGFPAGELKHGPLALIYDGIPVVAIATKDPVYAGYLIPTRGLHPSSLQSCSSCSHTMSHITGVARSISREILQRALRLSERQRALRLSESNR
jgi:glucosamine 6-phosphate synthetase-like amidotransferase/phosphosugar isomerase protein